MKSKVIDTLAGTLSCMFFLSGCYTTLSKTELESRGTKSFSAVPSEKMAQIGVTALRNLGYEVTQQDCKERSCMIRSAPKDIMVQGTTSGSYTSASTQLIRDGLAWQISISPNGKDSIVRAVPLAYRNGAEIMNPNVFGAEVMDPKFNHLWREFE